MKCWRCRKPARRSDALCDSCYALLPKITIVLENVAWDLAERVFKYLDDIAHIDVPQQPKEEGHKFPEIRCIPKKGYSYSDVMRMLEECIEKRVS